jgi:hypothetical protein
MFRFTIRELVLLTLVVALGVGWWIDRSRHAAERKDFEYKSGRLYGNLTECAAALRSAHAKIEAMDKTPPREFPLPP